MDSRHATASVRFVFVSDAKETKLPQVLELFNRVQAFLREHRHVRRSQISAECFRGKVSKARLDASLEQLLAATRARSSSSGSSGPPARLGLQCGCIGRCGQEALFAHFVQHLSLGPSTGQRVHTQACCRREST